MTENSLKGSDLAARSVLMTEDEGQQSDSGNKVDTLEAVLVLKDLHSLSVHTPHELDMVYFFHF